MKIQFKAVFTLALAVCGLATSVSAQNPQNLMMELQRVRQQFNQGTVTPSHAITSPQHLPRQVGPHVNQPAVYPQQPTRVSPVTPGLPIHNIISTPCT